MKRLVTLCMVVLMGTTLYGVSKTPIVEEFTGTWCQYCPGAARGLDELFERAYDTLVVVAYHHNDPFSFPEGEQRISYYSVSGYPTAVFNGTHTEVGGAQTGTVYPIYRRDLNEVLDDSADVSIDIDVSYDTTLNSGTIHVILHNFTNSNITANLIPVIVENNIQYNWFGMTKLDFVARSMPLGTNGVQITVGANSSYNTNIGFTVNQDWDEENLRVVVMFQNIATREIYNSAMAGVMEIPDIHFYSLGLGTTSDADRIPEPGDSLTIGIFARNMGTGMEATRLDLTIDDPYINILQTDFPTGIIFPGQVKLMYFATIQISPDCPTPHMVDLIVQFPDSNVDTIPFMITENPGLFDDFESGEGEWTHTGTSDYWHLTQHRSYSPEHSFYCGYENAWVYPNQSDASLISPYFVMSESAMISVAHYYSLETNYDYAYIEIDNGSGFWRTLETLNGNSGDWVISTFNRPELAGQTFRLRFRFISDYSVALEGWYVDDIGVSVGVEETVSSPVMHDKLSIFPNPIRDFAIIKLGNVSKDSKLLVVDPTGRVLNTLKIRDSNQAFPWYPVNFRGTRLSNGVYFIVLKSNDTVQTKRVVITK